MSAGTARLLEKKDPSRALSEESNWGGVPRRASAVVLTRYDLPTGIDKPTPERDKRPSSGVGL